MLIDPEQVPTLAEVDFEALEAAGATMRVAAGNFQRHGGEIDSAWAAGIGLHYLAPDGQALAEKMFPVHQHADALAEAGQTTADALQGYANAGMPIKAELARVKGDAEALVAQVKESAARGARWEDNPDLVAENERLITRWHQCVTAHDEARQSAAERITRLDTVGTDPSIFGRIGSYMGLLGLPLTGLGGTATTMTYYKYGQFKPKGPDGKFISVNSAAWWENAWRSMRDKNWGAKAYGKAMRSKWLRVSKLGADAGGILAAGTAAIEQLDQDSHIKTMPTEKRAARASVKGVLTGGGAAAGAEGGALVGAAIGTACGGVGAPVGAIIGGVIGGVAASDLGSWVADRINDNAIGK